MGFRKVAIIVLAEVGLGIAAAVANPVTPNLGATGTPAPSLTIGPDWVRVAPHNSDAFRFERAAQSGIESLSGSRQICDCQPAHAAAMLADVFKQVPTAQVVISATTICNQAATNFVMTGYAQPHGSGNNLDVYLFRMGDTLYTLTYAFRSDKPAPDAVATLPALCTRLRSGSHER